MGELQTKLEFYFHIAKFHSIYLFDGYYQVRTRLVVRPQNDSIYSANDQDKNGKPVAKKPDLKFLQHLQSTSDVAIDLCSDITSCEQKPMQIHVQSPGESSDTGTDVPVDTSYFVTPCILIDRHLGADKSSVFDVNRFGLFRIQSLTPVSKLVDNLNSLSYYLIVELWYLEPNSGYNSPQLDACPPGLELVSAQAVVINHPSLSDGIAWSCPVLFDFAYLSCADISLHSCLVSLHQPYLTFGNPSKQQNAFSSKLEDPTTTSDSAIFFGGNQSNGVVNGTSTTFYIEEGKQTAQIHKDNALAVHESVCRQLLNSLSCLQQRFQFYREKITAANIENPAAHVINDIGFIDVEERISNLTTILRELDQDEDLVQMAKTHFSQLSANIIMLWQTYLNHLASHGIILDYLAKKSHRFRIRRCREAFFVRHFGKNELNRCFDTRVCHQQDANTTRNSEYLSRLPVVPLQHLGCDPLNRSTPVIFQDVYSRDSHDSGGRGHPFQLASPSPAPPRRVNSAKSMSNRGSARNYDPIHHVSSSSNIYFPSYRSNTNSIVMAAERARAASGDSSSVLPSLPPPNDVTKSGKGEKGGGDAKPVNKNEIKLVGVKPRNANFNYFAPDGTTVQEDSVSTPTTLDSSDQSPDGGAASDTPVPAPPAKVTPSSNASTPSVPPRRRRISSTRRSNFSNATTTSDVTVDRSTGTRRLDDVAVETASTGGLSLPSIERNASLSPGTTEKWLTSASDNVSLPGFVRSKETLRVKLCSTQSFVSDEALSPSCPWFCGHARPCEVRLPSSTSLTVSKHTPAHLVICVHGLEGDRFDLGMVRTFLRLNLPHENFRFLLSEANQGDTYLSIKQLSSNLVDEILLVCPERRAPYYSRISFVGHSLGNLIIRAAISRCELDHLVPKFHTYLSLSGPHLGMLYSKSNLVNLGLWVVRKWRKSESLLEMTLKDAPSMRNSYLFNLSKSRCFALFKNVLLVGSPQDCYVPFHSARVEIGSAAQKDTSPQGHIYREMALNLLGPVVKNEHTTVVRFDCYFPQNPANSRDNFIGRAAHIAVIDSDPFLTKFFAVAAKYFDTRTQKETTV